MTFCARNRLILRDNNLQIRALSVRQPVPVLCDMRGNAISEKLCVNGQSLERNKSVQAVTTDGMTTSTDENSCYRLSITTSSGYEYERSAFGPFPTDISSGRRLRGLALWRRLIIQSEYDFWKIVQ